MDQPEKHKGNPMDIEKERYILEDFKIKKIGRQSLAESFGVEKPIKGNSKEHTAERNWREYLKNGLIRLKVHNTYSHMKKYDDRDGKYMPTTVPEIVPITESFNEIYKLIETSFDACLTTCILLTGSKGNGRSSAVYYAVNKYVENNIFRTTTLKEEKAKEKEPLSDKTNSLKISQGSDSNYYKPVNFKHDTISHSNKLENLEQKQPIIFIEADAFIYNQETKINNYFINELKKYASKYNLDKKEEDQLQDGESNSYVKFINYMRKFRVILYIKNVDVFIEEARQVYLYSLLDSINSFSTKSVIIFSTNCLFFLNRLEKRVKSRFSYKHYVFEDYDVENNLIDILEKRLLGKEEKTYSLNAEIKSVLRHEKIVNLMHRYHAIGLSIGWFINLFKTAFLLMHYQELAVKSQDGQLAEYFLEKIEQAKKLLLFEGGDAEIMRNMPRPAKLIILVLHEIYNLRNQDMGITFDKFRKKVKEVINDRFSSYVTKRSWEGFSENVLKENLLALKKMNYIHLDKTPVTLETVIQLNDSVSPTFLLVKVEDSEINFD